MNLERPSILEFCSSKTATALRLYCDYINHSEAEIFVVMAQKAICIFQVLLEEGLIYKEIKDKFISSSALDFGYSNVKGKKVAIVDDIIISGSAIASVANKLVNYGNVVDQNLEIITLARDKDYQTMQFTSLNDEKNLFKCALDVSDAECIQMSYELSHILAYIGRPYDADFPSYEPIEMSKKNYTYIFNFIDWDIYDITNDVQKDGNICAKVLFPKDYIKQKVWKILGVDLSEFVHLKVRVYIHSFECGKTILEFVPMALFHEISEKNINILISNLINLDYFDMQISKESTYLAKLRFLQFVVAHALKIAWFSKQNIIDCDIKYKSLYLIFGTDGEKNVAKYLNQMNVEKYVKQIRRDEVELCDLGYTSSFKCNIKNDNMEGYEINQTLYDAIQYWYEDRELKSRENLKYPVRHFLRDYMSINREIKRLQKGFSLRALEKIVEDADKYYNLEYLVSLFVDRSIDEGIVVPIIYYDEEKKYGCRAYRHGEDLPFGEADKSRLLYFLQCVDLCIAEKKGNEKEVFAPIPFEKMIVLFFQIGLNKYRIFNRFLGFSNDPILQQRFSVHGVIAAVQEKDDAEKEPHIYLENSEYYTNMVTNSFKDTPNKFIVTISDKKKGYMIDNNNIDKYLTNSKLNNISNEIKIKIEKIANVIGNWYWLEHSKSKSNFKDDIIALTSCINIYTFASSIATAIHFFYLYWSKEAQNKLNFLRQGNADVNFRSEYFDEVLPSGHKKHILSENQHANKVIQSVQKLFYDNKMKNEENDWKEFWCDVAPYTYRGKDELSQNVQVALKYMYFYSVCYEVLCNNLILQDKIIDSVCSINKNVEGYFKQYENLNKGQNDKLNLFSVFDYIEQYHKQHDRISQFMEKMKEITEESESVVKAIENNLSLQSASYTIIYTSVILIDLEISDMDISNDIFREIWNELPENEEKTYINIINFGRINENYCRYGIFNEKNDKNAIEYLINIYNKVHYRMCHYACRSKAIFIPKLSYLVNFRFNLKVNISKYATEFMNQISKIINNIKFYDYIHQLAFVKSWRVDEELYNKVKTMLSNYTEHVETQFNNNAMLKSEVEYCVFVSGNPIETNEKASYSTVALKIEDSILGTGILFCYQEEIYCVTCQHLLNQLNGKFNITANMGNDLQQIKMQILNFKEERQDNAWEDILVLRPELAESSEFDRKYMFNVKDYISNPNDNEETFCLYGFGGNDIYGRWVNNIVYNGRVYKGYYQLTSENTIGGGDSGAAIISHNSHKLLGIHAKSTPNVHPQRTLAIPSATIIDVLVRVYNKKKWR